MWTELHFLFPRWILFLRWWIYLLAKYAHFHLPNGLMPVNILVIHMSLDVSAKKISNTCMLNLLKEVALRHYHYICLFLLFLTFILRWIPQPAKKHREKESEELFFLSLHYISSKHFGTFNINTFDYNQWRYWSPKSKQLQLEHCWVNPSVVVDWHLQ